MIELYANRYIYNDNGDINIIKDKKYLIYSEVEKEGFGNGIGYVVLSETNEFLVFDSLFFFTEKQRKARDFNL